MADEFKNRIFNELRNRTENVRPQRGPKLYRLSEKTIGILTKRLADEYVAHYFYRNAANWCNDMNYKKAAAFFTTEANTELQHAEGLQKYMTDFNIIPEIPSVETVDSFESLVDIVYAAYQMELGLMMAYNKDSQTVFGDDITTFDFLTQYREGQKESVIEYNDLINALDLIDKNDKFQILYFEQTYM
jgi:ferritin